MRRSLVLVGVLGLGTVVGMIVTRAVVRPPMASIVKTSFVSGDDAAKRSILARVKAIQWPSSDGAVSLSPDGGSWTPNQDITLIGRTPQTLPDDHGSVTLAVINVSGDTADVVSLSEFHHGSFGENVVTVDCRVVEVELSRAAP